MTDDEKRAAMRTLPEDARGRMIDEAPNVVGHDRFLHRQKQVDLRDGYRKPQGPPTGGHA